MQFFTPDLYLRFASSDDEVADRANAESDAAIESYLKHLRKLQRKMPPDVRLISEMCLHDADVVALGKQPFLVIRDAVAEISLKHESELVLLIYHLADRVRQHESVAEWPFLKEQVHWLYDEVDILSECPAQFVHRILLSDGSVLEIPFLSVIVHTFPLPVAKQVA